MLIKTTYSAYTRCLYVPKRDMSTIKIEHSEMPQDDIKKSIQGRSELMGYNLIFFGTASIRNIKIHDGFQASGVIWNELKKHILLT